MIRDFERYHGVVLRRLVVEAMMPISISKMDYGGRLNSYLLNEHVFIHIKHSAKRLPPWQFSFSSEQVNELNSLNAEFKTGWLIFTCGIDGVVSLAFEEFVNMVTLGVVGGTSIRIDRSRRKQYRVSGKHRNFFEIKPEGVWAVLNCAFNSLNPR